jgi:hypothetical protein
MAVEGIDFAWSKPSAAEAKAVGAHWGAGYFSTDSSKNLTRSLVSSYLAAGLGVVTVWETTTGRATQGRQAGIDDAHAADAQRAAVGLPGTAPIHFAVDEDTSWASVALYFEGVISVLGLSRTGIYGGLRVIEGAHSIGIKYLWQTVAWSGGVWASYATIRQTGGTVLSGGSDLDFAEEPDFGQTPSPAVVTPPPPEDDFMALFANVTDFKAAVTTASLAALESQPGRDAGAYADLWWLDHALAGTVPPGANAGQKSLIEDIHKLVVALAETPPVVPVTPVAGK